MKNLVLFLSLVSSVFAAQSGSYIGFGAGYSMLKVDDTLGVNRDSEGASGSFALGHKYDENGRIYALGMYKGASSVYENATTFSFAYNFLVPVVDDTLSMYVGPVIGYTSYSANGLDLSGGHYGAEIGMIFDITDTIELEAGYRILKETGEETGGIIDYAAEHSQNISLQLNFYFDSEKYFTYRN